jgi:magnesium-protoporphyrin IX monomethyl ester (oxidative) cyclase
MYRIKLANLPFAALNSPSFALTQLSSVLESHFGDRVSVETLYLNQDLARHMGIDSYQYLACSTETHNSGLGEWFFRQSAFPELADNTEDYFQRYYPRRNSRTDGLMPSILEARKALDRFLDGLIDTYHIDDAELVGFTSMFSQNVASLAMARKLKTKNPNVLTVIGGANCETPMGEEIAKNVECIDFVFSGPALKSFPEFVQHSLNQEMEKCHTIPGVFSEANCVKREHGASGSVGEELDIDVKIELNYGQFFSALEKNFPDQNIQAHLFFETSRGCWWGERAHCTFCGLNGTRMNYRAMSPKNALEQFDSLFKYADKCSQVEGVDNIMPKEYLKEVFPYLDPPPNTSIFYEVKADLSDDDLQTLSRAHVTRVQPGIESLSTGTLKLMRKGSTAFRNLEFLKSCLTHGVMPGWNLLIGFPGEREEVYRKYVHDLPLLTHLHPPSGAFPVRFDRYSPYFVQADKYGLDLRPCDFYELIYPFGKEVVANIAYYFMDRNFRAEYFVAMVKWLNKVREKVQEWQARWQGESRLVAPKLYFKGMDAPNRIYDSRSGEVREHDVGETGREILESLNRRKPVNVLASELKHIGSSEIERQVGLLQEGGLIFGERGLFMNLVLAKEPRRVSLGERQEPVLVPVPREARRVRIGTA